MSNYLGRKPDFTPSVYTRYFDRTETRKSPQGHIYFNEDNEELSENYQIKRDLIFKRLFPSKYADSDNNKTENEQIHQNGNNNSLNNAAQPLGDFISLSNDDSSIQKKRQSSPETDVILSSSDENEDNLFTEERLPTSKHESIVGHIHPRSTIENVRTILIRELYQRTSDCNTEWLKCKMELPRDYINPKYYADFQRRYKNDVQKNANKKMKSTSSKSTADNTYQVFDLTTTEQRTTEINNTSDNDVIIETSSIVLPTNSSNQPEFIILDSDEDDDDDDLDQETESTYFIDRSSTSSTTISQTKLTSKEDYHTEDSKYAQLPTRTPSIIRPILSKHQRRKKPISTNPPKPLVSAIDRIIDHMDQSDTLDNSKTMKQQNLLIKQIKKTKEKKEEKSC